MFVYVSAVRVVWFIHVWLDWLLRSLISWCVL